MKIEDISITSVVHAFASLILLGTISLFAYEVRKPAVVLAAPSQIEVKISPLSTPAITIQQLHRLPQLPERYQRKVLVYAVRYKHPKPRKVFMPKPTPGKVYIASNQRLPSDD